MRTHEKDEVVLQSKLIELATFEALLEKLRCKHHRRPLELGKGAHIFLVPSLLHLEVYNFIVICLKVSTRSTQNLKMQDDWSRTRCWRLLWKNWDVNGQFHGNVVVEGKFFHFQKNLVPFRGLELHNELLKGANLIIKNCQRRRWIVGEWCVV
jgi:hypothetical protein